MAFVAARTHAGVRKRANEDACCIQVAQLPYGEILMAIVCDGVGGLKRGNLASTTVVRRFVSWFEHDLPKLVGDANLSGSFDVSFARDAWEACLCEQNELIRTFGAKEGIRLGTTFTGILAHGGKYLVGHVGDCRAYRMNAHGFTQITEDQTRVARDLATGVITPEEAKRRPKNVILQAVGAQPVLRPAFYEGSYGPDDLFVICCDGAYNCAGNEGIRQLFQGLDHTDERALAAACDRLLQQDMEQGEKDNLTVLCFSGQLESTPSGIGAALSAAESGASNGPKPGEQDEDDLLTMVDSDGDTAEDELPTMVDANDEDEDDLPTMVDQDEALLAVEDDLPTMVDTDEIDEDDLATMVDGVEGPDDDASEDDLPTIVDADDASEDDLPTMVEGGDAQWPR